MMLLYLLVNMAWMDPGDILMRVQMDYRLWEKHVLKEQQDLLQKKAARYGTLDEPFFRCVVVNSACLSELDAMCLANLL
jgi:hypothetical protein